MAWTSCPAFHRQHFSFEGYFIPDGITSHWLLIAWQIRLPFAKEHIGLMSGKDVRKGDMPLTLVVAALPSFDYLTTSSPRATRP